MTRNETSAPRKKIPIAYRMQIMLIIFLLLVFSMIFISFNLSINTYAKHEADIKFAEAVDSITNTNIVLTINGQDIILESVPKRDIQRGEFYYQALYRAVSSYLSKLKFNFDMSLMICNTSYDRIYPESIMFPNGFEKMDAVKNAIKDSGQASYGKVSRCYTPYGNYFYTSLDLDDMYGFTGLNLVFFTNADMYKDFIANTNLVLIIILMGALALSSVYVLLMSRNISLPVKKLSSFADDIGHGNFSPRDFNFRDKELFDLNNRMNVTAKKLRENDDDQKTFFQNVSHELKTPLMSIKGYAEGLKYGIFSGDEEKNGATDIIISETDRLNVLVSDLLYISKMDKEKSEDYSIVDLNELICGALDRLRGILVNSDKKIVFNPRRSGDYRIMCDENSLIRAILNVTANCVQYAKTTVEINSSYTDKRVIMSVKDDGNGISPEDMPHIFKRFYKGKNGKHGLGLSIAKTIIEQHGGELKAISDSGGAEFIIALPAILEFTPKNI